MEFLHPPGWPRPKGYSNGVAAEGRLVFVGGLVGWDEREEFPSDCLAEQTRQTLLNVVAVLGEAGAKPEHVVRMTWYITDKLEYRAKLRDIGAAYRETAMAMVQVAALMEDRAKVEIEATAVIPEGE